MKKQAAFIGLLAGVLMTFSAYAEDISHAQVVLRGLDKITGRISTMTVNVGEKAQFGALDIYTRVCYAHPPEETPENTAYLDIVENKPEGQLKLFSGWMFSSSPALSAMDHPVFDIWVLRCQGDAITPPEPTPLILENPLEFKPVQPKVKIIINESENAEENSEAPMDPEDLTKSAPSAATIPAENSTEQIVPVLVPIIDEVPPENPPAPVQNPNYEVLQDEEIIENVDPLIIQKPETPSATDIQDVPAETTEQPADEYLNEDSEQEELTEITD